MAQLIIKWERHDIHAWKIRLCFRCSQYSIQPRGWWYNELMKYNNLSLDQLDEKPGRMRLGLLPFEYIFIICYLILWLIGYCDKSAVDLKLCWFNRAWKKRQNALLINIAQNEEKRFMMRRNLLN